MKVYGSPKNQDTQQCRYGCCGGDLSKCMKNTKRGIATKKIRRKTARQIAKFEIEKEISDKE